MVAVCSPGASLWGNTPRLPRTGVKPCCGVDGVVSLLGPLRWTKPLSVCSFTRLLIDGAMAPAPSPLQWGSMRLYTRRLCVANGGHSLLGALCSFTSCPPPESTIHCHRGELRVLKASDLAWMIVHGMSKHRPDVAKRSCAGLGAHPGERGAMTGGPASLPFTRRPLARVVCLGAGLAWWGRFSSGTDRPRWDCSG